MTRLIALLTYRNLSRTKANLSFRKNCSMQGLRKVDFNLLFIQCTKLTVNISVFY